MEMSSSFRNRAKIVWLLLVLNVITFVMLMLAGGSTDTDVPTAAAGPSEPIRFAPPDFAATLYAEVNVVADAASAR